METVMDWLPTIGYGAIGGLAVWLGPRAFTFLRAIASGWNKNNVAGRLAICKACPRVKQRDRVGSDGGLTSFLYCDECKCGSHHIAELHTKLGFNNIQCPMGKFGPASAMTVHEGHDLLVARDQKEWAEDQRQRTNMMAGRDRDDNGTLGANNQPPGSRTAQAQAQLQPSSDTAAGRAQRARIKAKVDEARVERRGPNREETHDAAKHAGQTNKIWGDRQVAAEAEAEDLGKIIGAEETNNTASLAGTDHEGRILVDQKESSDGGHSLDERNG